jgi:hypothetical protein
MRDTTSRNASVRTRSPLRIARRCTGPSGGFTDLDAIGDAIYAYQGSVLHIPKPDSRSTRAARPKTALRALDRRSTYQPQLAKSARTWLLRLRSGSALEDDVRRAWDVLRRGPRAF